MPVKEPQQNTHRWWGTLTRDASTEVVGGDLSLDQECIFIKTSADSHFIPHGTVVKLLKILGPVSGIASILSPLGLPSRAIEQITKDLANYPHDTMVTEIQRIDWDETPPLAGELFHQTETLFFHEGWLARHSARVGKIDIEVGRKLPRLPIEAPSKK